MAHAYITLDVLKGASALNITGRLMMTGCWGWRRR